MDVRCITLMSLSEVGRARIFLMDAMSLILNYTMSCHGVGGAKGFSEIIPIAALSTSPAQNIRFVSSHSQGPESKTGDDASRLLTCDSLYCCQALKSRHFR